MSKPVLQSAKGERSRRTPIWFLRQAGRYLPEYREIRRGFEFVELCSTPKKAAEVTLQPLRRFDLDAAIIFSDILIPCIALGQELTFGQGHGPVLTEPVRDAASLAKLVLPADVTAKVGYLGEAIELAKQGLSENQTMIGFAGAPFTVASYMIEGQGSKNFSEVKKLLYRQPEIFHGLMSLITEVSKPYVAMQVQAGAEYIMLFDTWANQLPAQFYRQSVFPYVNELAKFVQGLEVPVAYFPGQGSNLISELSGLSVDVLHVDWRSRLGRAIEMVEAIGLDVSIQGNLDPQIFMAKESLIDDQVETIIQLGRKARAHIFNVGHGLLPSTPISGIERAIAKVRSLEQAEI